VRRATRAGVARWSAPRSLFQITEHPAGESARYHCARWHGGVGIHETEARPAGAPRPVLLRARCHVDKAKAGPSAMAHVGARQKAPQGAQIGAHRWWVVTGGRVPFLGAGWRGCDVGWAGSDEAAATGLEGSRDPMQRRRRPRGGQAGEGPWAAQGSGPARGDRRSPGARRGAGAADSFRQAWVGRGATCRWVCFSACAQVAAGLFAAG
jgi:hypothetical protein